MGKPIPKKVIMIILKTYSNLTTNVFHILSLAPLTDISFINNFFARHPGFEERLKLRLTLFGDVKAPYWKLRSYSDTGYESNLLDNLI